MTFRFTLAFWHGLGCWTGLLLLVALTYGIPGVLIVHEYIFIPERVFLCAPPMAVSAAACSIYCLRTMRRYGW